MLKISPVLTVVNDEGERVGKDEGPEDDAEEDENEVEVEGFIESTDIAANTFTLVDGTTVRIADETEMDGDFLSLVPVADAVAAGQEVEAEVEGVFDSDGTTILAAKIEFETEGNDADEDGKSKPAV